MKLGALSGLTSVILVMMMGQTRVFYAMSRDGACSPGSARRTRSPTAPRTSPRWSPACSSPSAPARVPMSLVGELVSIGTLLAFVLVCVGVFILRYTAPDLERPFRVPGFQAGRSARCAAACIFVM